MTQSIVIGDVRPRIQYNTDGVQTDFIYPFAIFKDQDIEVYLDDVQQTAGFSVTGAGSSDGGSVVFDSAPAQNSLLTLRRFLTIERLSDFAEGGAFHASVINQELDYLVAVTQQNAEEVERTLMLDPTDEDSVLTLPKKDQRAGKTLAFDENGAPIVGPDSDEIAAAQINAQTASQAATDAQAAQQAAETARDEAQTFDPNAYRLIADQIETADIADGAVTQAKIDPAVILGGPSLGTNSVIRTNAETISEDITIPAGTNGMTAGPITITQGFTVTVNGNWSIV